MSGARRILGICCVVAAIGTRAGPAHAAEQRTFTLDYTASGSCPGERELLRQISRRTSAAKLVPDHADLAAVVHVDASAGSAHGDIEWRENGARTDRTVKGQDCTEVVSALALILALALDPDADTGPIAPAPKRTTPAAPVVRAPPPVAEHRARRRRWHFGLGVTSGVTGGVTPAVEPYIGGRLALGRDRDGVWAPRAELSALAARGTSRTGNGTADLSWWTLRLGLCPVELSAGAWFALPCATFDAGRLSARGYATRNGRSGAATWYGPGAMLRAGWRPLEPLSIALEGGAVAPLAHDRFYFVPHYVAQRIPDIAGYVGAAIGVRL